MALDWIPIQPDRLFQEPGIRTPYVPFLFSAGVPINDVISRLWSESQPWYPNQIWRTPWQVPHGMVSPFMVPAGPLVPFLSWQGKWPDFILPRTTPISATQTFFIVPSPVPPPPDLRWLPSYPDQVVRRPWAAASVQSFALDVRSGVIPPLLSWQGQWPDRVYPKPAVAFQQSYVFHPLPVPGPLPPSIGRTYAVYPDRIWPKPGLHASQQQFLAFDVVPRPNPPPPIVLTWQPWFPSQTYSPARLGWAGWVTSASLLEASAVGTELRWTPSYPVMLRGGLMPAWQLVEAFVAAPQPVVVVPVTWGWQPTAPERIVQPPWMTAFSPFLFSNPVPSSGTPVPPSVVPVCIMFRNELIGQPMEANAVVGSPSLANEILAQGLIEGAFVC